MIIQEQDGQTIMLDRNRLLVNGVAYELPENIKKRRGHSLVQVNHKIYIDASASMDWGEPNKSHTALKLAAAMGFLSVQAMALQMCSRTWAWTASSPAARP